MAYISTCRGNMICVFGNERKQISNIVYDVIQAPSTSLTVYSFSRNPILIYAASHPASSHSCLLANASSSFRRKSHGYRSFKQNTAVSYSYHQRMRVNFSTGYQILNLLVCFSTSQSAHAEGEAPKENEKKKNVFSNYSVIGIPGDGRCLFRAVSHGVCVRSGKDPRTEMFQRELADNLRAMVADEFVKRREETEWFIEGDFDTYISKIRKPHEWGGEPELLMASHVLRMPITVYMHDKDSGGLRAVAEYGKEYSKENPIQVLYHGSGHYDALHIFD